MTTGPLYHALRPGPNAKPWSQASAYEVSYDSRTGEEELHMDEGKRREPRLFLVEREPLAALDDRERDNDTGNYIAQLANAWAAVRRKSIEQS